jgi:methylmalonyl-CoA carboxyltransferase 12S subunit
MALFLAQDASGSMILLAAVALVIAGWIAIYRISRRAVKRAVEESRREMDARVSSLQKMVEQYQASAAKAAAAAGEALQPSAAPAEEISPDLILIITAAVTAYLGKKVRIRSAKALQTPYEIINPWAQQGRVFVQASHNLAQHGQSSRSLT